MLNQQVSSSKLSQALKASDSFLGELSINQHHDAIAGTAMQYVTDDYQLKLYQVAESSSSLAREHIA